MGRAGLTLLLAIWAVFGLTFAWSLVRHLDQFRQALREAPIALALVIAYAVFGIAATIALLSSLAAGTLGL